MVQCFLFHWTQSTGMLILYSAKMKITYIISTKTLPAAGISPNSITSEVEPVEVSFVKTCLLSV